MHTNLDIEHARNDLRQLHDRVSQEWGRIIITREGRDDGACVLISKAELDCIEQALEILHESPVGGAGMRDSLQKLVKRCGPAGPHFTSPLRAMINDPQASPTV